MFHKQAAGKSFVSLTLLVWCVGTMGHVDAADNWVLTSSMTDHRSGHTDTLLSDGRVLVTGGYYDFEGHARASAEIYNPATGLWTSAGSMSTPRLYHTATLLSDGRVLVTGGVEGSQSTNLATAEIYDPVSNTWTPTEQMHGPRFGHAATRLADGRILVAGGSGDLNYSGSADIYDPVTGTWTTTNSMSIGRVWHTMTLLADSRVLVTGGQGGQAQTDTAEIYDPAAGTWSETAALSTFHQYAPAIPLNDGRVLIAGGSSTHTEAEIYDPLTGTWSLTGSLNIGRGEHKAALLADSHVLVAGGSDNTADALDSAEIYDPVTGTWSLTTSMSFGRASHTLIRLGDGRILAAGGYADPINLALSSAEIFVSDSTPPDISCGASDAVWHDGDVIISCTASDPESGLANAADASFTLTTSVPSGTETATASTGTREVCNTLGQCGTAGPITANKVDKKAPTIAVTSPAANATYQLNASVAASYACADGGSGVASCQGTVANGVGIDTASTGSKTFTVTAIDNVVNQSTSTATYSVVPGGGGGQTSADLSVTLSAAAKVAPGETLQYSVSVKNLGKATATGVTVIDALPSGTVFVSASSSQGSVSAPPVGSNGTLTVNIGSLANGATATVGIVVRVGVATPVGTTLTNTATVSATTSDLNGNNNSATQRTNVSKK